MKMFRIMLDDDTEDESTNFGYRDYYVLENSIGAAIELVSLVESRIPSRMDSQVEVAFCYHGKHKISAENIVKGKPTGYFKTQHIIDPTIHDGDSFSSIIMPFIPFSIRKHYVDRILTDL